VDLRRIGDGHDEIIAIAGKEIPVSPNDERAWGEFQFYHRGAAGVLRFSPIGFSPSRREAVVFLEWECGPACGHDLVTALRADSGATWRVADMLLLSTRQHSRTPQSE
jgi:hypothetical protein